MPCFVGRQHGVRGKEATECQHKNQGLRSLFWLWWHPLTPWVSLLQIKFSCLCIDWHKHLPCSPMANIMVHKDAISKKRRHTLTRIRKKKCQTHKIFQSIHCTQRKRGEKRDDKSSQNKSRIILSLLVWSSLHNFRLAYLINKTLAWMIVDDNLATNRKPGLREQLFLSQLWHHQGEL